MDNIDLLKTALRDAASIFDAKSHEDQPRNKDGEFASSGGGESDLKPLDADAELSDEDWDKTKKVVQNHENEFLDHKQKFLDAHNQLQAKMKAMADQIAEMKKLHEQMQAHRDAMTEHVNAINELDPDGFETLDHSPLANAADSYTDNVGSMVDHLDDAQSAMKDVKDEAKKFKKVHKKDYEDEDTPKNERAA